MFMKAIAPVLLRKVETDGGWKFWILVASKMVNNPQAAYVYVTKKMFVQKK